MTQPLQNVFGGPRIGRNQNLTAGQIVELGNYRTPIEADAVGSLFVTLMRSDDVASFADQAAAGTVIDVDAFARVSYGAGGAGENVDVDFVNGVTLAIPGNWVNVVAHYPPPTATPPDVAGTWNVTLGCTIGFGPKSSTGTSAAARRTLRTADVPAGAAATLSIPTRALDVTVYAGQAAAIPLTSLTFDSLPVDASGVAKVPGRIGNLLATMFAGPATAAGPSSRVLIPNAAKSLVIQNGTISTQRYIAIFSLSL